MGVVEWNVWLDVGPKSRSREKMKNDLINILDGISIHFIQNHSAVGWRACVAECTIERKKHHHQTFLWNIHKQFFNTQTYLRCDAMFTSRSLFVSWICFCLNQPCSYLMMIYCLGETIVNANTCCKGKTRHPWILKWSFCLLLFLNSDYLWFTQSFIFMGKFLRMS